MNFKYIFIFFVVTLGVFLYTVFIFKCDNIRSIQNKNLFQEKSFINRQWERAVTEYYDKYGNIMYREEKLR